MLNLHEYQHCGNRMFLKINMFSCVLWMCFLGACTIIGSKEKNDEVEIMINYNIIYQKGFSGWSYEIEKHIARDIASCFCMSERCSPSIPIQISTNNEGEYLIAYGYSSKQPMNSIFYYRAVLRELDCKWSQCAYEINMIRSIEE